MRNSRFLKQLPKLDNNTLIVSRKISQDILKGIPKLKEASLARKYWENEIKEIEIELNKRGVDYEK